MSEQEKASEAARLLLEWADGKTLQQLGKQGEWTDYVSEKLPIILVPSLWRVKPEPRKAWSVGNYITENQSVATDWREHGDVVTEWKEVLP